MKRCEDIGVERLGDPTVGWQPLMVKGSLANTDEDISRNIEAALGMEYTPFNDLIAQKSGAAAVIGSGPSLKKNWTELRRFNGDIIACNAACQFLLEKGITPQYMFCFDADPLALEFFTPHKDITYLIASRVVPEAFKLIEGCKIVLWHAAGDAGVQPLLEKHGRNEPMVMGGSAAVTRALALAMTMGYKDIHIYGGDSSFAAGDTHIRQSTTVEKRMAIMCNGRVFEVAPWMTVQVNDLEKLGTMIAAMGARLHFHGDGLMQWVARTIGYRTDYDNAYQRAVRAAVRWWITRFLPVWQAI